MSHAYQFHGCVIMELGLTDVSGAHLGFGSWARSTLYDQRPWKLSYNFQSHQKGIRSLKPASDSSRYLQPITMPLHALRAFPQRLRPTPLSTSAPFLRTFVTTPVRALKEDSDRDGEHFEQKKQEQLQKQKEGKGEWHESLASGGEASVKADREEIGKDDQSHMEDLQKQTAAQAEQGKI